MYRIAARGVNGRLYISLRFEIFHDIFVLMIWYFHDLQLYKQCLC